MTPSPWLRRWAHLIPPGGRVLDLACGGGRNAVYLAALGYRVTAVDRDLSLSEAVRHTPGVAWLAHDLEAQDWPFGVGGWQGVVVVNYLHRPLFEPLCAALAPGGALIYATFAHAPWSVGRAAPMGGSASDNAVRDRLPPAAGSHPAGQGCAPPDAVARQRYGPRNPQHLLLPGELLEMARGKLRVVAYEDVEEETPVPARRQRLAALKT